MAKFGRLAVANRDERHDAERPGSHSSQLGGGSLQLVAGEHGPRADRKRARRVAALLANLASIIVIAQADGSWPRLKACTNDHCQWMFYDHSKNANGSWCSMTACGQRHKAANTGPAVLISTLRRGIAADARVAIEAAPLVDAAQPGPLGDRVEAGEHQLVERRRRRDVLGPHARLDAEQVSAGFVRPAGAGLERADVVEPDGAGPARSRRRPVVVERHVEVVRVGGADDDVVPGLGEHAGVGGRLPRHDVAVARLEPAVLGDLLPRPDLPAGDAVGRLRRRRP